MNKFISIILICLSLTLYLSGCRNEEKKEKPEPKTVASPTPTPAPTPVPTPSPTPWVDVSVDLGDGLTYRITEPGEGRELDAEKLRRFDMTIRLTDGSEVWSGEYGIDGKIQYAPESIVRAAENMKIGEVRVIEIPASLSSEFKFNKKENEKGDEEADEENEEEVQDEPVAQDLTITLKAIGQEMPLEIKEKM